MNILLKKSLAKFPNYNPIKLISLHRAALMRASNLYRPEGQSLFHGKIRYDENHFLMNDTLMQEVKYILHYV